MYRGISIRRLRGEMLVSSAYCYIAVAVNSGVEAHFSGKLVSADVREARKY
jgi:hypothetical protein